MKGNLQIVAQAGAEHELPREFTTGLVPAETARCGPDVNNIKEQSREETIGLVRRLFFSGDGAPQVVIFAGVEHRSGCTSVCTRVAGILSAHVKGLVCLVDADLRSPSLHRHFETEAPSGAAAGEFAPAPVRQSGRPLGTSNLWLLSHGIATAGPQTLEGFERLRVRVSELRNDFNYILIDSPPINVCAEAALLGRLADGLVMIVEANTTRRNAALRARNTLDAAGVRLLGAVLNKRTFPIPERLYRLL